MDDRPDGWTDGQTAQCMDRWLNPQKTLNKKEKEAHTTSERGGRPTSPLRTKHTDGCFRKQQGALVTVSLLRMCPIDNMPPKYRCQLYQTHIGAGSGQKWP